MGLDAFVACTCYRDGLASSPPVDPALLTIDGQGCVSPIEDSASSPLWEAIRDWMGSGACEHIEMELVHERVGNIAGIEWFRNACSGIDGDRFPHLKPILTGLSGLMGGQLPSDDARDALPELDELIRSDVLSSTRAILADGRVIDADVDYGCSQDDASEFRGYGPEVDPNTPWIGLAHLGVEGYGFAVRTRDETPATLMRARVLKQEVQPETEIWMNDDSQHVAPTVLAKFTNLETTESIHARTFPIRERVPWPDGSYWDPSEPSGYRYRYPEVLQVSERTVMVTEALSTLQTLRRLFDASARSGNPVVWC